MEQTIALSLAATRESPFNPRKRFNQKSLNDLALSIQSQGVMQPVVARVVPDFSGWELVFGHRRFRAAKIAGLDSIPAFVRDMSDAEVKVAQIHENLDREDVSALEEAEGFKALMDDHGATIQQLMDQFGKSRSYIYGRLKMLEMAEAVRDACNDEDLSPDIAQYIARIPSPKLQISALDAVRDKEWIDGRYVATGWRSVRVAKKIIMSGSYTEPLADATFDLEDASLHPDGRVCSSCPYRSGNDLDLTEACGGPDVCTDIECFASRDRERIQQRVDSFRAAGKEVLEGADAQVRIVGSRSLHDSNAPFLQLDVPIGPGVTVRQALDKMGDAAPPTALALVNDGEPLELVDRMHLADLRAAAGFRQDPDADDGDEAAGAGGQGRIELPLTEEELALRSELAWDCARVAIMRQVRAGRRSTAELRLVAAQIIDMSDDVPPTIQEVMGWASELEQLDGWRDDIEWVLRKLPTMTADELAALMVIWAISAAPVTIDHQEELPARVALAKAYGINPMDPDAPPQLVPVPTPAAATKRPRLKTPNAVQTDLVDAAIAVHTSAGAAK